jgi:spermidine/putrescine transport system substrate-binding protein
VSNNDLTRRQLIERGAVGSAFLAFPGILAACGGEGGIKSPTAKKEAAAAIDRTLKKELVFSNWPLYIDVDEKTKKHPTLDQFEKETGTHVRYIEDINDNQEFFGKIQGPLSRGQSVKRDIIVLTDNSGLPQRMIKLGWLQKLDKQSIPNAKNLIAAQQAPAWDPNRDYTLPWQSGMTGIGYNPDKVGGELTDFNKLLDDPKLKGKISLLSEMGDAIGLTMQANGDDMAKVTKAGFDKAVKRLQKAVDSGQIRQFTGNDYTTLLAKGDVWACMAWSGDMIQLQADNPKLKWNLPDSGGAIWTDNMMIPTGGHVYTASKFMDFVYDPKIAAQIEAYVNYICPVEGAKDEMLKIDKDVASNPLIFPTEQTLAKVKIFDAEALNNQTFKKQFAALVGA